jgi:ATP-binding cassette subfamily G (WHITE) protein 2 (PDR)
MLLLVLLEKVSHAETWQMRLVPDNVGLNVEQRKRLSIGVELVARPALLLFLDEPTSGLDSQTSWNILQLLRKLAAHGQAILCTIHQPSAILFEQFDRLLFLAKGGKTVYYGQVGRESRILIDYFERNGATSYQEGENPAEWMLEAIGAAPGTKSDVDWHQQWLHSPERVAVRVELDQMEQTPKGGEGSDDTSAYSEFAAPFGEQLMITLKRSWWQLWRSPNYIYSKLILCAISVSPLSDLWIMADMQGSIYRIFILRCR